MDEVSAVGASAAFTVTFTRVYFQVDVQTMGTCLFRYQVLRRLRSVLGVASSPTELPA
jgi:hypothetical protein